MNAFELRDIKFGYKVAENILDIKSWEVKKKKSVFIHGPSGSGKSTLLNLLAGVLAPQSGTLNILGESLSDMKASQRDRFRGDHIGFIFQSFNLIPYLNIKENLSLPYMVSKMKKKRIDCLDEEITELTKHLGLTDYLQQQVSDLSIGQQQRVGVARALIGSPEIVIADEPTSSLDDDITESFMQLLMGKHKEKGFTLIFVSHDLRLEKYFDEKISLRELNQAGVIE